MKLYNSKDVQVIVSAGNNNYYLPPKSITEVPNDIQSLPAGVRPVVDAEQNNSNSKNKKNG